MPPSKNGKFWWIEKGETLMFKLPYIAEGMLDATRGKIKGLAVPIMVHVNSKPFSSGKKQQTCAGKDRCDLCMSKHTPTRKYPVHVLLFGAQYAENENAEKIVDMASSAHDSLLSVVQIMLDNGATEDDILATEYRLTRLMDTSRPPYYDCTSVQSGGYLEAPAEALALDERDHKILKAITQILVERNMESPRGSVERTLREKYEWSDAKIELAFGTVLDKNGHYTGDA